MFKCATKFNVTVDEPLLNAWLSVNVATKSAAHAITNVSSSKLILHQTFQTLFNLLRPDV